MRLKSEARWILVSTRERSFYDVLGTIYPMAYHALCDTHISMCTHRISTSMDANLIPGEHTYWHGHGH
jgi:hypothetical protein